MRKDAPASIKSKEGGFRDSTGSARGSYTPLEIDLQRSARFISEIRRIQLSPSIEEAVKGYEKVGHRNSFLWKWVRRGVEITTLSSVDEDLWDHVCDTKTLGVMFDVLLDDVADATSDSGYLEKLISISAGDAVSPAGFSQEKQDHFEFAEQIWNLIWSRARSYPRFDEFEEVLVFDYAQLMNSMRYSLLIRHHPSIMNLSEHDSYLPHNMHMMVSGTLDLMASSDFGINELNRLRTVLLYAQHMGRIGNLVTTWEREIRERDYSSGVFALALALGVLKVEDLREGDQESISKKIHESDIEARFLYRWQKLHERIIRIAASFKSIDIYQLVQGLETLIQLHLGSRGLK